MNAACLFLLYTELMRCSSQMVLPIRADAGLQSHAQAMWWDHWVLLALSCRTRNGMAGCCLMRTYCTLREYAMQAGSGVQATHLTMIDKDMVTKLKVRQPPVCQRPVLVLCYGTP